VGQTAPDFKLARAGPGAPVELRQLRKSKPVLIVFGSYTCPKLRASAPALEDLYSRYGQRVAFVFIYIREAHAGANWQSTINQREGVQLEEARTSEEKQQHAALCIRQLKFSFPAAIDGLDNPVEALYGAWPSRAYLVGTDGRILWSSALGELDFKPGELEAAISKTLRGQ
jgi:thiol-disulfide isomerase/thioredoxin